MADNKQWNQQRSQVPAESRAPRISSYRNGVRVNITQEKTHNQNKTSPAPVGRVRSNTQASYSQIQAPQNQVYNIIGEQQNRSRSSSWPAKPLNMVSPPTGNHVQRTRSGSRPGTPKKTSEPTTPRKKRKRLNPQRRSFYKALHNDFPAIAEALREARQGNCVLDSLRSREIVYTIIEARPPQDPTNLNVRRYDDMVFIWDPSMESWLQVPGQSDVPPLSPARAGDISGVSPSSTPNPYNLSTTHQQNSPQYLPSFNLSQKSYFPDNAGFTFEGPFISDSSQSEDEDFYSQETLNDFLPMNIINDVL